MVWVFLFCTVTWIFFRAGTLEEALYVFANMFQGISKPMEYFKLGILGLSISKLEFVNIVIMLLLLFVYDYFDTKTDVIKRISSFQLPARWTCYVLLVLLIILFVPLESGGEFIYFQF